MVAPKGDSTGANSRSHGACPTEPAHSLCRCGIGRQDHPVGPPDPLQPEAEFLGILGVAGHDAPGARRVGADDRAIHDTGAELSSGQGLGQVVLLILVGTTVPAPLHARRIRLPWPWGIVSNAWYPRLARCSTAACACPAATTTAKLVDLVPRTRLTSQGTVHLASPLTPNLLRESLIFLGGRASPGLVGQGPG